MMNLNSLIITLLLFSSLPCIGQNTLAVKFAPTSLLNPINPAIHMAFGISLKDKVQIQPELGIILKHHLLDTSDNTFGWRDFYSENRGFFVKLEIRPKDFVLKDPFYVGFQLMFLKNNYIRRGDVFDMTPEQTPFNVFCSTCVTEDEYVINKTQHGIKVTLGYQETFFNRLVIDVYSAFGLTLQNNIHSKNAELHMNPAVADRHSQFGLFPRPNYYMPHYPGLTFTPYFAFLPGIKLGYQIN